MHPVPFLLLVASMSGGIVPPDGAVRPVQELRRPGTGAERDAAAAARQARADREDDLLGRALAGAPDYAAALRRAAAANVREEVDPAGGRGVRQPIPVDQLIAAEEARLAAAVERRRRERLGR